MSTKATIQGLINSLIRSNPALIDKTEHADVEDMLLNEFFPTTYNMQDLSTTPNQFSYDINFSKIGNLVYISGWFKNNTSSIITTEAVLVIDNPLYYGKNGSTIDFQGFVNETHQNIHFQLGNDTIGFYGNCGAFETLILNSTYKTND